MTKNSLTEQELEILRLLSRGQDTRQVARSLKWMLSVTEVNRTITKMMDRYRCDNRVHLVATAIRHGVIE